MKPQDAEKLLQQVRQANGRQAKRFVIGPGEGAAVNLPSKGNLISSVHCFIEGVHFDLAYTTPQELGHKLLAIGLSDLAAAGTKPRYAMLTLGVTQQLTEIFVSEFFYGVRGLAKRHRVDVEGGNTVQSPTALVIHVLVVGEMHPKGLHPFKAQPGDLILVSGHLGASAAGLNCLRRLGRPAMEKQRALIQAHLCPEPRVGESLALRKSNVATAAIDLTDGLATDLNHLLAKSKVGAYIDETLLPISDATTAAGRLITSNPTLWALYGGEDYELLFTVNPADVTKVEQAFKQSKASFSVIGEVKPKRDGVMLRTAAGELSPFEVRGWNHLVRRRR